MKPVAWVKDTYLPLSETFIYEPLISLKSWHPVVIAKDAANLKAFQYGDLRLLEEDGKAATLLSSLRLIKRALGRDPGAFADFILSVCRERAPRAIHAHFGPAGFEALKAAKELGLPLLTSFYGYDVSVHARDRKWRKRYGELFSGGKAFATEGPHMKRSLIEMGCPEDKVRIVHIGVDINRLPFKPRFLSDGQRLVILLAGRFVEKKGIEYALGAADHLARAGIDFELRLAGDGPLRRRIEGIVESRALGDRVKILGFLSHAELVREIYRAHIGIVPSVTASNGDSEGGAPKVLLEMEATGLPIVAFRHADIPYVAPEGMASVLVDERDSKGLAEAIKGLIAEKEKWPEIGRKASDFARANFSLEDVVGHYEKLYEELCG